jgi:hypothetical protein
MHANFTRFPARVAFGYSGTMTESYVWHERRAGSQIIQLTVLGVACYLALVLAVEYFTTSVDDFGRFILVPIFCLCLFYFILCLSSF